MTKIIIYPRLNLFYSAYYIKGLYEMYGRNCVRFATKKELIHFNNLDDENFCFIVKRAQQRNLKISIDFNDDNNIPLNRMKYYTWSDIYGKVNTNWTVTPRIEYPKIIALAPSFGIRIWSQNTALYIAIKIFYCLHSITNYRKYFGQYYLQKNKLYIDEYSLSEVQKNYIFCFHTLWHSTNQNKLDETTNKIRADFMDVCIGMHTINFEGGFIQSQLGNNNYMHLQTSRRISQREYIEKSRKSLIAFNTPAVWNCHGWKLGEYLCMGKAIISTPLLNDLPSPLLHGVHVHFVSKKEDYSEAIKLINENDEYRRKLEQGARDYYDHYVSPKQTIYLLGLVSE